jgi:hypothetical protein
MDDIALEAPSEAIEEGGLPFWFSTMVALLIAVVSIVGAVVAWRASEASGASTDADLAALRATVNLTETRTVGALRAYSDYAGFVDYYEMRQFIKAVQANEGALDDDFDTIADAQDAMTLAGFTFTQGYLRRDGTYDVQRQLDEAIADAARRRDINAAPHIQDGEDARSKSDKLLLALTVLVVSLVFFTLIEAADTRLRYALLAVGVSLALVGSVGALLIELGRL